MKRAIIIEDDFIISLFLRNQLKRLDIEVVDILDSGEDLTRSALEHKPDLLLVDVELNGKLNGIEAVRNLPSNCKPGLIFITGSPNGKNREQIRKLKPLALLGKPVGAKDLSSIINTIYEKEIFS
ncbi:response regulator [Natronogracilivirga saccharolytica]|uniref:Response regulator n=1 Tax=Natronogracilivirga saccharolytica TaxID=2812953 RepID=A0A8J7S8V7_9BACT|nr:response regulator [Natronogracilivirga saccharolytica]MBP3192386.1 response regulator [Natronogracilivirga saccharolytica]